MAVYCMPEPACKFREIRWMPDREVQSIKDKNGKETKNAPTKPRSTQLAFLLNDNGIKKAVNNRILKITMCHCLVMT